MLTIGKNFNQKNRSATHFVTKETDKNLHRLSGKLALKAKNFSPLFIDFNQASIQKRRQAGKKQGLVRACQPKSGMKILDATAGWGKDAAILASFGAHVLMIERNPVMAKLLEDAMVRLEPDSYLQSHLSFKHTDAIRFLKEEGEACALDVIYIDPMHPERQKSALVKKEMQVLQQMIGPDEDARVLLDLARKIAKKRVVVKWPNRQIPMCEPDLSVPGKTVRFDVYLSKNTV